jgi:hypothetical protein
VGEVGQNQFIYQGFGAMSLAPSSLPVRRMSQEVPMLKFLENGVLNNLLSRPTAVNWPPDQRRMAEITETSLCRLSKALSVTAPPTAS